jgi:hypothetical protein
MNPRNKRWGIRFYQVGFLLVGLVLTGVLLLAQKPSLPKEKTVSIKGRPLAGVAYLTGYLRGGLGDHYEVFVFGLESKSRDGSLVPVKVMYRFFYKTESALPDAFLDASKRYQLQVIREPNCDETVESLSYQKNSDPTGKPLPSSYILQPLTGAPKEVLKSDLVLPCYVMRPGKYKTLE